MPVPQTLDEIRATLWSRCGFDPESNYLDWAARHVLECHYSIDEATEHLLRWHGHEEQAEVWRHRRETEEQLAQLAQQDEYNRARLALMQEWHETNIAPRIIRPSESQSDWNGPNVPIQPIEIDDSGTVWPESWTSPALAEAASHTESVARRVTEAFAIPAAMLPPSNTATAVLQERERAEAMARENQARMNARIAAATRQLMDRFANLSFRQRSAAAINDSVNRGPGGFVAGGTAQSQAEPQTLLALGKRRIVLE